MDVTWVGGEAELRAAGALRDEMSQRTEGGLGAQTDLGLC